MMTLFDSGRLLTLKAAGHGPNLGHSSQNYSKSTFCLFAPAHVPHLTDHHLGDGSYAGQGPGEEVGFTKYVQFKGFVWNHNHKSKCLLFLVLCCHASCLSENWWWLDGPVWLCWTEKIAFGPFQLYNCIHRVAYRAISQVLLCTKYVIRTEHSSLAVLGSFIPLLNT